MAARPITDTLRLLQGGQFLDECSERMAGVVKQVDETGKAGRITITLDFKKSGPTVAIVAKVADKTPEPAPDADVFWPTVEGNLSTQNPNQRSLSFGSVDRATGEIQPMPAPKVEISAAPEQRLEMRPAG